MTSSHDKILKLRIFVDLTTRLGSVLESGDVASQTAAPLGQTISHKETLPRAPCELNLLPGGSTFQGELLHIR